MIFVIGPRKKKIKRTSAQFPRKVESTRARGRTRRAWEEVQRIIKETRPGRVCPLHMSDGPILLDALRERIIGRVIGLYQHPGYGNS